LLRLEFALLDSMLATSERDGFDKRGDDE